MSVSPHLLGTQSNVPDYHEEFKPTRIFCKNNSGIIGHILAVLCVMLDDCVLAKTTVIESLFTRADFRGSCSDTVASMRQPSVNEKSIGNKSAVAIVIVIRCQTWSQGC